MTLIMRASINAGTNGSFIMAATDTRTVYKAVNTETLEFGDETLSFRDDNYSKVIKISDNVLINAGGMIGVSEPFKKYIVDRAEDHYFIDDFEPIFKEAYEHIKKHGDKFTSNVLKSNYLYVGLIGFFKDGSPGELILQSNGKIFKQSLEQPGYNARMFAPTEDIMKNSKKLMDINNSPYANSDDVFSLFVDHFILVHSIIASQESELVSDKCIIHLINKNKDGEISCYESAYDLSEQIQLIKEKESS